MASRVLLRFTSALMDVMVSSRPNILQRLYRFPFSTEERSYFGHVILSWSIWAFLLSLGSSAAAFVESDSLSTNGISELLVEIAPPVPTLEATFAAQPTTSTVLLVVPTTSEPSITILASEFCALVHTSQTLTTTHFAPFQQMAEMRAHQDQ
ncbi:hypothetical protein CK203_085596 [Vitis vinifera]|uniref:Uncharacterized protein n=1 Tax=Vitis vinifera TaxID=29760 RepID=A0A438BWH4_VITVI|nr:hypothetical protein CK203_085596 [Vitis vinifera]